MNYFDLKFFHIFMMILLLSNFFIALYNPTKKIIKISYGVTSLLFLVSGIVLMQKLGLYASDLGKTPTWILVKFLCWLTLAVLPPLLIKRMPKIAQKTSFIFILIFLFASFLGIYKI